MSGRMLLFGAVCSLLLIPISVGAEAGSCLPAVLRPPDAAAIGGGGLDGVRVDMQTEILDKEGTVRARARVLEVGDRRSSARLLDGRGAVDPTDTLVARFRDPLVPSGRIIIQSDPHPDEVWVDGVSRGTATSLYVEAGLRKLRVTTLGYEPWGERIEVTAGRVLELPVELTPVPLERSLVRVPGGTFDMGAAAGPRDERPVHTVTVRSFLMRCCEVTCGEYWEFDPSHRRRTRGSASHPADNLNWWDAASFSNWLSRKQGLRPFYEDADLKVRAELVRVDWSADGYRLPAEAEWEFACRAGTITRYYWGDSIDGSYLWFGPNANGTTHPVASRKPNALGLWDMSGNVAEWCNDWYDPTYYRRSPDADPRGPMAGSHRVIRGGSWAFDAQGCRSSERFFLRPLNKFEDLGFRLVRPDQPPVGGTEAANRPPEEE